MNIKSCLRSLLIFFHLDISKNIEYDRLTEAIMKRVIKRDSNCIDVGCHKGEILDSILKCAPMGKHFAFEPIPYLFTHLENKFKNKAIIYPYALSDKSGASSFQLVKNAPAYSGINKRKYDISNPEIEEIKVELRTLDEIIPSDTKINFIKIDVEGGEFGVLKGAENLLKKDQPTVIFECGLGASDYYNTDPILLYNFITQTIGLKIYTLRAFIKNNQPLTANDFEHYYQKNTEYYFIASV